MGPQRRIHRIFAELCAEQGIDLESLCHGWLLRLSKGDRTRFIYGNTFGLNHEAAQKICRDKVATAAVLQASGVPCVEHRAFHLRRLTAARYVPPEGNWAAMAATLDAFGGQAVCKPADSSKGKGVFLVNSLPELEDAAHTLFSRHRTLCMSPYLPSLRELRCVVLDGRCELIYAKERVTLTGDGQSSLARLWASVASGPPPEELDADYVPGNGETVLANWRHNLSQGAAPQVLMDLDAPCPDELRSHRDLALAATKAIGVRLAAVDLLEKDGAPVVLEVNSGITFAGFAEKAGRQDTERAIYSRILKAMFD